MDISVQRNEELQSKLKNMNENIFGSLNRHDFGKEKSSNTLQMKQKFITKIGAAQTTHEKRRTAM